MSKVFDLNAVLTSLKSARNDKSASSQGDTVSDVTDPNEKGGVSVTTDSSGTNANLGLGEGEHKQNTDGSAAGGESGVTQSPNGVLQGGSPTATIAPGNATPGSLPTSSKLASRASNLVADFNAGFKKASEKGKGKSAAAEPVKEEESKTAGKSNDAIASDINFTPELWMKIAKVAYATEEGRQIIHRAFEAYEGEAAARQIMAEAAATEEQFAKYANAYEQGHGETYEFLNSLPPEQREAAAHSLDYHTKSANRTFQTEIEKQAYYNGVKDADAMMGMPGGLPPEGADMTGVELPGAGMEGPPDIEELAMILEQLVASGEIDPAMAEQILVAYMQDMEAQGGGEEAYLDEEMGKVASVVDSVLK